MKNIKTFVVGKSGIEVLFYKVINDDDCPAIKMNAFFNGFDGGICPAYDTNEERDRVFDSLGEKEALKMTEFVASMVGVEI